LPDDLVGFLQSGQEWNYNAAACAMGAVTLNGLPELKVETFHLQTYATPWEDEDPNAEDEEDNFYLVPAVSLVKACENYLPKFLLVWLPQEGLYGSGDEEHGHLLTFPGATWKDIAEQPATYMEAQFTPGNGRSEYLRPWPKYPYGRWEK
jgi:hypothetical protein